MWIWDERSGQAISVLRPETAPGTAGSDCLRVAGAAVSGLWPVRREYASLLASCYGRKSP